MEWNQLIGYAVIAIGASTLGYLIGTRRARAMKKRLVQQLNSQSLDLLDFNALKKEHATYVVEQEHKNKTLKFCMERLARSNERISTLEAQLTNQTKQHFVQQSATRARAVDAVNIAKRATLVARDASLRLKRLETIALAAKEVKSSEPSQHLPARAIAVSMIEKIPSEDVVTTIKTATNHDSARRSERRNSSEASVS